ncbi:uncharacterized protein LOC110679439 [Aedes aegypti]|uniref:Uncharacterized protein n=1 Tax=Aedes aegypti TaxID=7159 RepID=A0A6I8TYS3_AEDAE|nr:uncharacterized protein LOC110679439 [Aedes aegypti]
MVSYNSFRLLGYLYAGLCLTCSVLFLITATLLLSNGEKSGEGIIYILFSIISCVFDVYLFAGIVLRRVAYVNYHLKFISFIYAVLLIGLFGGCVVIGILFSTEGFNLICITLIASTAVFCFGIVVITILYTLSVWVIRGVNSYIKYETVRFITEDGEMA